jgi:hypothetical protein
MQVVALPFFLESRANYRGHTRSKKHIRMVREQRNVTRMVLDSRARKPTLPCTIKLTRIAPRFLDWDDNLPMSFKSVKDGICDWLGVDDRDREAVKWSYDQKKPDKPKGFGCLIEIGNVT